MRFGGKCTGECDKCVLKINREEDNESKYHLLDEDDIYYERAAILKLGFDWCCKKYCNVDGCLSQYLLDVKNKRKKDGSGEKFTKYSHDLGLILGKNEVMYMATLKNSLNMIGGFFVYCFENGMYGVEVDDVIRYGMSAPFLNHEVYYVPFKCWKKVGSGKDLIELINGYHLYKCPECKQSSYTYLHLGCAIKRLKRKIMALIDDEDLS
jgi:hypothetical protein